jgi:endogenous inhibitor of DNA gyrase (YacG/DUF329 family)
MAPCPICKRPAAARAQNSAAPFCSPRCKQIDLGKWFDESYRVPLSDTESSEEAIREEPS